MAFALSLCLSLPVSLSLCLSIFLSVYLSVCLSVCLSICLSVCLLCLFLVFDCVCPLYRTQMYDYYHMDPYPYFHSYTHIISHPSSLFNDHPYSKVYIFHIISILWTIHIQWLQVRMCNTHPHRWEKLQFGACNVLQSCGSLYSMAFRIQWHSVFNTILIHYHGAEEI